MQALSDRSELYVDATGYVDVAKLIDAYSAEEHAARADVYFEAIDNPWAFHLKKPFQSPDDARATMAGFSAILSLGNIRQGDVVVDFGCGTGWLTVALALMRCRPIGLDISPAALRIAAAYAESLPTLKGAPIRFEAIGETLPLDDASVDRVVCFDAFHHVRDPKATLAEFARVLRPGGMALFHEPGPEHSRTPLSQMEMREFAVIENDVVIERLWEFGREAGFSDLVMAAYTERPMLMDLETYNRGITGMTSPAEAASLGRELMHQMSCKRVFSMKKQASADFDTDHDSRSRNGLAGAVTVLEHRPHPETRGVWVSLEVTNTGTSWWRPSGAEDGSVNLGAKLLRADGQTVDLNRAPVSQTPLHPGESRRVEMVVSVPPGVDPGSELRIDLVSEMVCWFYEIGSTGPRVPLRG